MLIYNIMPHSHLRGKAGDDGRVPGRPRGNPAQCPEVRFNWQTVYAYKEPKRSGRFETGVDLSWDNSPQNPANPDPTATVRWGDQTFEEMGIGFVRFATSMRKSASPQRRQSCRRQPHGASDVAVFR